MLIGRESEQQAIDRLVSGARIGTSGALALTGEAGVGKTALLRWAETRLEGFRVLGATGTEPEREVPFAGLLTVLRPALGLLDEIPAPQARALSAALALSEGPPGDRFAIGAATLSLLCRYAEDAPVAVLLDDVQLLDPPTMEALTFASRRLSADPLAVLMAAREGECDEMWEGLDQLHVTGLGLDATRSLAKEMAPAPLTPDWVVRVHEVTGGNPLAVTELAQDPEALVRTSPGLPPPVSAALGESFARRLSSLGPEAQAVLLVAVVCNGDLRLTGAACADLGLDPDAWIAAREVGLADAVGTEITFRHPLVRAAIYRQGSPVERRRAHAAAARALPDHEVDRRAWHLSESVWEPDEHVAGLLHETGDRAVARSAYAVASVALERAARLSPAFLDEQTRLLAAADTAWAAGQGARATVLLDGMAGATIPAGLVAQVQDLRAAIALRSGSVREAAGLLERAAENASPDERALLLAEAVHATFYLFDGAALRRLTTLLAPAVTAARSSRARAVGTVAAGVAKVLSGGGGIDELRAAIPLLTESEELGEDPRGAAWLMYVPLFIRDADTGRGLRAQVDQARRRAGVGALPALLFLLARDEATTHSWARAEANYNEAVRLARDTSQTNELAVSLAALSWLEARTGQEVECRAHATEALALCRSRDIHLGETWTLFALGELELALANPAAAATHLGELDRLLGELELGDPDISPGPELVEALLRLGRAAEAAEIAATHLRAADHKGQPWARARARRCAGLLAADGFDDPFREALALHEETPDLFETARTALAYGARLRRAGRRVEAREQLRAALAVFTDLGAEPWADQAATELDLTGERVPPRPLGGVNALTPQELQVALLLAEGRTTREAAAALFLSPKTVEYHLRKVYTKLGVRSRAELADALSAT